MRRFRSLLLAATAGLAAPAGAETLREALAKAYNTNPSITGQRAALRATDESVPIARAAGIPSISANGGIDNNLTPSANTLASPQRQLTGNTQLTIPIYQGGAVSGSIRAARTRVEAGRETLRGTESDLFTAVVGAYMDVIRDQSIVALNQQNVHVLDVNLQASRDRFQVGDLTRTDVAQSEARLALANAQLQSAQAQLITSRENYIRVVGSAPVALEAPPALPPLPTAPDIAVNQALADNPSLLAANKQRDATKYDVQVARSNRLPKLSVIVGGNYYNYLGSLGAGTGVQVGQNGTYATAGVALNVPIFQGGRVGAQVRQAEALRSQSIEAATGTERAVVAQTRSAYAVWRSSQQVIASAETAVNANKLSLEGVRAENSVGTRTILDILNAEQELLNSQVTLVTARRDSYVAGFALLAAMGRAQAKDLGLDGGPLYNPVANYDRVRHRYFDYGGDGEPSRVSTSTVQTPAQDASVPASQDPMLQTPVDTAPHLTTGADAPSRKKAARVGKGPMGDMTAEPSMEDILSSIKRIIAEEGDATPAARARRPARAAPAERNEDEDETVLELNDPMPQPKPATPAAPQPVAEKAPPVAAAPAAAPAPAEPIVSPSTAAATRGSLEALSRLMVKPEPASDGTLEGLVREMLRPMLSEWLDANLPGVVGAMVEREIAKITGIKP